MDYLIAGLGNPGREHARQRHNIGFMALDRLHDQWRGDGWKNKFDSEVSQGSIQNNSVLFVKPQTYMNLSGDAVAAAARFYKIPTDHIVVLHDELDVPFGETRIKLGGGNGGHNGLRSIDAMMGTPNYWRVRLGIGHPGQKHLVTPHVLGNFFAEEEPIVETWLDKLAKDFGLMLSNKANDLQRRLNTKPAAPKVEKETTNGI